MTNFLMPFKFAQWLDENKHLLQPPIGNKVIFSDADFIVMAVGGPNARKDYHVNHGAELFFQVKGKMCLKTMIDGAITDIIIDEGELFQLPANIPHSPQRFADTIGIVIERKRKSDEQDAMQWYCESCNQLLYSQSFHLQNIEKDLKQVTQDFMSDIAHRTCTACQQVLEV